jgi:hypothetical protein
MKRIPILSLVCLFILSAFSSSKNAIEKSNHFSAVVKSVERLKSDPGNNKVARVLKDRYELALKSSQQEMDCILTLNKPFKWETAVGIMEKVNNLNDIIRSSPSARTIIPSPKLYTNELTKAREKVAEERYNAGVAELEKKTHESARLAFDNFIRANDFLPGYKDVSKKIDEAKAMVSLNIVLEAIPVQSTKDELSSEFFYSQILEYLNSKYPAKSFVSFLTPKQAKKIGLQKPDLIIRLEFSDFVVKMPVRNQQEDKMFSREKIESNEQVPSILYDENKVVATRNTVPDKYFLYEATVIKMTDKVISNVNLNLKIFGENDKNPLVSECFPGSYTWENKYYIINGDTKAFQWHYDLLSEYQQSGPKAIPSEQDFLIELTKPIYDKLTSRLDQFFRKYS